MFKDYPVELLAAAVSAAKNAYAPYSHFAVGAAVQTTDGTIFSGANMENASYGLTVCAEVGALQAASTAGQLGEVVRIAVVGGPQATKVVLSKDLVTPCGRCRQLILESAQISGRNIDVWCATPDLSVIQLYTISELLPHSFGAAKLSASTEQVHMHSITASGADT
jgi:cytidine deaminase